jgi:hypothetical protein
MCMSKIYAHVQNICACPKYMRMSKIYAPNVCVHQKIGPQTLTIWARQNLHLLHVVSPPCSPQVLCPCPVLAFIQTSEQSGAGIATAAGFLKGGGRCEGGGVGGGEREGGRGALIQVKEGGGGGWVTITTRVQGVWACTSPLHQDSSWLPS